MIQGSFFNDLAYITLDVSWGTVTLKEDFLVDTGFKGGLLISPLLVAQLGLDITRTERIRLADNSIANVSVASVIVNLESEFNLVEVFIIEGFQLVGMDFFLAFEYKIIIDCKERTVVLEK